MGEVEKIKIKETKKPNNLEGTPLMMVMTSSTIRGIVMLANEKGIKKNDIVSLIKEKDQFVLIYFK